MEEGTVNLACLDSHRQSLQLKNR